MKINFTHDKMPITNSKVVRFKEINAHEIWIFNQARGRNGWILA